MMGIYFIFAVQLSLFFLLAMILNSLTDGIFSADNLDRDTYNLICIVILTSLFILDIIRYSKKSNRERIETTFRKWKANGLIKTWQIFLLPILIIVLTILGAVLL